MSAFSEHARGTAIALQVQPKASRTEIAGAVGDMLKVRVAAPPVDGAANQELVNWFAKQLKVPKSAVQLLSGERGRRKVILIEGLDVASVKAALDVV
jgi:uncharacterized protein (TIGR00251 family)